jgi:hypothetical protein
MAMPTQPRFSLEDRQTIFKGLSNDVIATPMGAEAIAPLLALSSRATLLRSRRPQPPARSPGGLRLRWPMLSWDYRTKTSLN